MQTGGGATGYMWYANCVHCNVHSLHDFFNQLRTHETWDLPTPPEMVTFSKKFQIGGFYYKDDTFQPKEVSGIPILC